MYDRELTPRQRTLAAEAAERIKNGKSLNHHQKAAWEKYRYQAELQQAVASLSKVSFDQWVEWSGLTPTEARQDLARLGVAIDPIDGVNVLEFAKALHDYIDRLERRQSRSTGAGCAPR